MPNADPRTCRLVGGALCLDFANSVDWARDGSERPRETDAFAEPSELAVWGRRLHVVARDARLRLDRRELVEARRLRAAVHAVFAAVARGETPARDALSLLEQTYACAVAAAALSARGRWAFEWPRDDPRRIRFAVAVDAVDLLRAPVQLARVRICPGSNCGWLFLDTSGRRRWCSMDTCGSRAKMRRLYARRRASSGR